ncbi:putative exported protein [Acinetobacter baumannii]|uniref:hypothetical protein n=1 Tax=Acinetobacter baumannii TaxID=470 RepID=UPI00135F40F2|nr:hypothetical protein [Acinetobacter baumannii]MDC5352843.1 hypothetical protein [Acinetobacter baumannii]CAA0235063.1 putative exported protein [Acinetobacter baumannii]
MNKKHIILSLIVGLIVGGLIGAFGYSKTFAKYDAISTACVMVNEAVKNNLLAGDQVKTLGQLTGADLEKSYPTVASKFNFSPESLKNASKDSICSQFIVGVNESK